jgi:hypothetical protein
MIHVVGVVDREFGENGESTVGVVVISLVGSQ